MLVLDSGMTGASHADEVREASPGEAGQPQGQQPVAAASTRQASASRAAESVVTRRRKTSLGTVWTLSKLTTQPVGTPSALAYRSSSDTRPRRVRVSAATTTEPIRAATGSRVTTSTGRSPLGVAANQRSPRRIAPLGPILGRAPGGERLERTFADIEWLLDPLHRVIFARQFQQVLVQRLPQHF